MAVTSAQCVGGSDGGFDDKGDRNYTEEWQAFTDDLDDHASTVLVSSLIPQMFDLYLPGNSFDSGAYVNRKSARRDSEVRTLWHITISYSTAGASNKQRDETGRIPDNPLDAEDVIQYRTGAEEVAMEDAYCGAQDATTVTAAEIALGRLVVANSANDAYDPPYMIPRYYRVITITRNEADYDDAVASALIGTVNDAEVGDNRPRLSCRLADVTAEEMRKAGTVYHRVTYEVHYRASLWIVRAMDQGFNVLSGGNRVPARDTNDARYGSPVPLDGSGVASIPEAPAVFWPYLPYEPASWNAINLPDF